MYPNTVKPLFKPIVNYKLVKYNRMFVMYSCNKIKVKTKSIVAYQKSQRK